MVRKIPTQVPAMVSRLIESSLVTTPPPWYNAVLANPPPVLPPRQTSARSRPGAKGVADLPAAYSAGASSANAHSNPKVAHHQTKHLRQPKLRPAPIVYPADRIRRQFFADFPFEALRPVSLVEAAEVSAEHPIRGAEWTSLAQRGAYPTVEDTIAFTLHLHESQNLPLSSAYAQATDEFVQLRAAHEVSTLAAAAEARAYGAVFKRDEWTRTFDLEQERLNARWTENTGGTDGEVGHRWKKTKIWTAAIKPDSIPKGDFTGGRAYAQRWQMPPAVAVAGAAPAAGDLVSAIGSGMPSAQEMDQMGDLELLDTILGANSAEPSA